MSRLFAILVASLVFAATATTTHATADELRFTVSLDGKPIGYHRFQLRGDDVERELLSEARFNVKVLFINAYRYEHDDHELWRDGCLQRIDARTDDNGTRRSVRGSQTSTAFKVAAGDRTDELSSCVITFAYWNPRILDATHLLNPQTGEYVPVHVVRLGTDSITVQGAPRTAERYRL
ncbi:MAG TPA: DUF6134 family protein, partial [Steroidobacteraceae bacterium]|nr:DUF6134 family protein [Steroidobacteraceae bacterium]